MHIIITLNINLIKVEIQIENDITNHYRNVFLQLTVVNLLSKDVKILGYIQHLCNLKTEIIKHMIFSE